MFQMQILELRLIMQNNVFLLLDYKFFSQVLIVLDIFVLLDVDDADE
jgi:hypothetical protein